MGIGRAFPGPLSELQQVPWGRWGRRVRADVYSLQAHPAGPSLSRAVVKPEALQKATVELLDQGLCAGLYGHSLTDRMMCAGYLDGKVDSCQVSPAAPGPCPPADGAHGSPPRRRRPHAFWSSTKTSPAGLGARLRLSELLGGAVGEGAACAQGARSERAWRKCWGKLGRACV